MAASPKFLVHNENNYACYIIIKGVWPRVCCQFVNKGLAPASYIFSSTVVTYI
jgi:hypothetical protein